MSDDQGGEKSRKGDVLKTMKAVPTKNGVAYSV